MGPSGPFFCLMGVDTLAARPYNKRHRTTPRENPMFDVYRNVEMYGETLRERVASFPDEASAEEFAEREERADLDSVFYSVEPQ